MAKPQKIPLKVRQIAAMIRQYDLFSYDCDKFMKMIEDGYVDIDYWIEKKNKRNRKRQTV